MRARPAQRIPGANVGIMGASLGVLALAAVLATPATAQDRGDTPAKPQQAPLRPPVADAKTVRHPDAAEFRARRDALARAAGEDALVVVLAAGAGRGLSDRARSDEFFYVSPAREPLGAVVLHLAAGKPHSTLFLQPRRPAFERWNGRQHGPDEATAKHFSFDRALPIESLGAELSELLESRKRLFISASAPDDGKERREDLEEVLGALMPEGGSLKPMPNSGVPEDVPGAVWVQSARRLITDLRAAKSDWEVDKIRRAVSSTVRGIHDALTVARPGLAEYQLAAILEFHCKAAGCAKQAFPSIIGSGPNSCILHYRDNERIMQNGDIVVMDVGGEYEGYAADVTRSFPVNGKFTKEQARVYDAVLEAQTKALAIVKPGVTLGDIHKVARETLREHGLDQYFFHGTCHSVGLNVHDSWSPPRARPLEVGSVLTVEPGVYIAEQALGVRIEDTVLVTTDGYEVLSSGVPKTRAEIEALMAQPAAFDVAPPR